MVHVSVELSGLDVQLLNECCGSVVTRSQLLLWLIPRRFSLCLLEAGSLQAVHAGCAVVLLSYS